MALYYMTVKASVHHHAALHIDKVAHLQVAEIASVESLLYSGDGVGVVARERHYRQTHTVVRYRLVDFQLVDKRACGRFRPVLSISKAVS